MTVRIGTRGSDLALWQARHVAACLGPESDPQIVVIETRGDAIDDKPLTQVEGKAFFTAEIEAALLAGEIDLAVHSHKDLETEIREELAVVAVPVRAAVEERLLIAPHAHDPHAPLLPIAIGASVGTSAPRRRAQLETLRPDLEVHDLRGNVPTRVRRCVEGRYDAVMLAAAGLDRLELDVSPLVAVTLPVDLFVPAPAQGALALQVRADDPLLIELLQRRMHHPETAAAVAAERSLLARAGGGCHLPLGALVQRLADEQLLELEGEAWRCTLFLGDDHPELGDAPRWAVGSGHDADGAARAAWELATRGKPTHCGPFAGLKVVLVGSAEGGSLLGGTLSSLGARVAHERVLDFRGVRAPDLPAKLARLKPGDVLAVTSQEAARRLAGQRVPSGVTIAAVGPGTARALAASGLRATLVGKGGARALADRIEVREGGSVVFPSALDARPDLPDRLRERGISVDRVVVYRTVESTHAETVQEAEVVVYMSPSSVATAVAQGREKRRGKVVRIGLGRSTCDALQDEDLSHERPHGSGPDAVVALLGQLFDPARRRGTRPQSSGA